MDQFFGGLFQCLFGEGSGDECGVDSLSHVRGPSLNT